MGRTFIDLPPEVQSSVVSWVLYPHHIANVCLVSRQLHDVSMPFLYHTMYLNVDRWKVDHLRKFVERGHNGHQHIRTLDVDSDNLKAEPDALKLAKDILQVLPRKCLTSFRYMWTVISKKLRVSMLTWRTRCPLETGVDNDLMILLASTQSRLDFLSLGPLKQTAMNIPTILRPWPPTTKTIVIPWKINLNTDVTFYQQLLQRSAKTLQALTVRSETFIDSDDGEENGFIYDPEARNPSEALCRALFSRAVKHQLQPPLEICDLNLQNQDLSSTNSTWLRAIDFSKLRTLQLWNCDRADDLLVELMALNSISPLRLHGLVLSFEHPKQAPLKGLEFVRSIRGLKYLNLCYCPKDLLSEIDLDKRDDASGDNTGFIEYVVLPHAETIKDLYFGIGANDIRHPLCLHQLELCDFTTMSKKCQNIRQLAIPMPRICADDFFARRWQADCYTVGLDALAALPNLKILRILTWPMVSDPEFVTYGEQHSPRSKFAHKKKVYLKYLDVMATSIARRINLVRKELQAKCPEKSYQGLSVLIFGSAEQADQITRPDGTQRWGYFPSIGPISYKVWRKETEFGTITKARRIDSNLMECEEPIAYVVDEDTDQGLSLEAYSWGSCNPSWV